jgi:tetratricopeptide (TPR) repeat protein
LFLFVLFSNVRPSAQVSQQIQDLNAAASANAPITMYETAPNTAVIVVHVFADEKPVKLDRSARIDLTNVANHLGVFITAPAHEQAVFTNVVRGRYSLAVNAVGYLSAHQEISVLSPLTQEISVVLKRDPYAVTLREALGPMSDKAKKEAKKAVSLLKADRLSEARKHLENAYKLAPSNADVNFLLGYMYFAEKDYGTAGTYLGAAARISPNSSPTLSLLGRTQFLSKNYPAARSALEQAILADDEVGCHTTYWRLCTWTRRNSGRLAMRRKLRSQRPRSMENALPVLPHSPLVRPKLDLGRRMKLFKPWKLS